ncbi:MAG TPA: hypothetical protein VF765_19205 [Polyangiaceae bacterium]
MRGGLSVVAGAALALVACSHPPEVVYPGPKQPIRPSAVVAEDTAPKEDLRLVPPEVYMRTYLQLFGGLAPLDVQKRARGGDGAALFDSWDDYVSALGFPDYRLDIPRQTQTNALMVATFERLGVALCDRAVEHDLKGPKGGGPPAVAERVVFAFDVPRGEIDAQGFATRFDVLHRTFLGYPAALAPSQRGARFYQLYRDIVASHAKADPKSRFTPEEAGWAAVCYGLVRHPEFHLY